MWHRLNLWWYFGGPRRLRSRWYNWRAWRGLDATTQWHTLDSMKYLPAQMATEGFEWAMNDIRNMLLDVTHQPDRTDYTQSPRVTIALGTGDCEDFAELARWLFACAGIEADVVYLLGEEREAHAVCITRDGRWVTSNADVWEVSYADSVAGEWTFTNRDQRRARVALMGPFGMSWQCTTTVRCGWWPAFSYDRGFPRYTERWPRLFGGYPATGSDTERYPEEA